MYRWNEETNGRDAPHKDHDHAMDDMRYFAVTMADREDNEGYFARWSDDRRPDHRVV